MATGVFRRRIRREFYNRRKLSFGKVSDTNVAANVDALTLTEQVASIAVDVTVSAAVDALTLTTFQAAIAADTEVSASTDALTLTVFQASIAHDRNVAASTDALTLTEFAATIQLGVNVSAGTDALTLTEQAATIVFDVDVLASVDALTLTEYQASITAAPPITAVVPDTHDGDRHRKKRDRDREELRKIIEKAAGLLEDVEEFAETVKEAPKPETVTPIRQARARRKVIDFRDELSEIRQDIDQLNARAKHREVERRIGEIVDQSVQDIILQVENVIADILDEILQEVA